MQLVPKVLLLYLPDLMSAAIDVVVHTMECSMKLGRASLPMMDVILGTALCT